MLIARQERSTGGREDWASKRSAVSATGTTAKDKLNLQGLVRFS